MKLKDVPQDQDPSYLGGHRLCYAVDENGHYVQAHSTGWSAEEIVKGIAWKAIDADLAATRADVRAGKASPLKYFMKARMMDPLLLAQNMGISRLRVWWHLRPKVYARLSSDWLDRYADCLEIPVEKLRSYRGEEEA